MEGLNKPERPEERSIDLVKLSAGGPAHNDIKIEIVKPIIDLKDAGKVLNNISIYIDAPIDIGRKLTYMIFLKGGANKGAPTSLSATIIHENKEYTLTKKEILICYKSKIGDSYIRRLAECLATLISEFAERRNLQGDLARQISRELKIEEQLTPNEKAWCSSFNQNNPECQKRYPRLYDILIKDYEKKFKKTFY
jgi:hypothetical protein